MRILVVEDSKTETVALMAMLEQLGFSDVATVTTGADAIRDIGREGHRTGLVLMDILLPDMSGIDVCHRIRKELALVDMPIIFITAHDTDEFLVESFEAGGTDYIAKPVGKVELGARVKAALRLGAEIERRKLREKELEGLARKLEGLSNVDGLTGVGNRRCLNMVMQREWNRACRNHLPLAALMIDIDYFKNYNDLHGHLQGDDCLRKVAEAVQASLKRPADFIARYGGEEFLVLLPETDCQGGELIAENIRDNVAQLAIPHGDSSISDLVTVSIGVTCLSPSMANNLDLLVERADMALYQAKTQGRDRVRVIC